MEELPQPKLAPSAVLIEVRAASVNPVDWKVMTGGLDGLMDAVFPVIPGWDVAGVVVGLGPDTPEFAIGDEVIAYARKDTVGAGTFAELVAVPVASVARKPASLSFEQAAGLPLAGGDRAAHARGPRGLGRRHGPDPRRGRRGRQLRRPDRGGAGARVIGTASESNHDFVRELGAEPVAYGEGVVDRIRALAPEGVDAVADFVGGQLENEPRRPGRWRPAGLCRRPRLAEHGGRWIWVRPDGAESARLAALADDGKLTVEVARTFGLDEVAAAFAESQTGHVRGKLVIVP